ncbi:DUF819 family protein [Halosquirtibacter laminarini]|uniref:DUF819 family protein n=1 Tax=Halosquirtibacter laminarini TaxID=3374600 RepID=A0AC61NMN5_9BACT|nr:DUF819 family protein [Prolixibacteraceae bacterium]
MIFSLYISLYLTLPFIIEYITAKIKFFQKIGPIALAYIIGIMLHLLIPINYDEFYHTQETMSSILILIAMPLLLFSIDLKKEIQRNKSVLLSFMIGISCLFVAVISGVILFKDRIINIHDLSGMVTGLYSGGTPNLASMKEALQIEPDSFLIVHSLDFLIGSPLLFFFMTIAARLFRNFLPVKEVQETDPSIENRESLFVIKKDVYKGIGISVAIVLISIVIGQQFQERLQPILIILLNTTLAIVASSIKRVNSLRGNYRMGNIFIIGFSLVLANMADFSKFSWGNNFFTFLFMLWVIILSFILHLLVAKIFKRDADQTLIAMVALYYSPAFVPVVSSSIKNRSILVFGIIIGMLGFTFGNYIGIIMYYLTQIIIE